MRSFGAITARVYGKLHGRSPSNQVAVDLLELTPEDQVLEVGCGPGAAVALAAERIGAERVCAIDPSATFVEMAQRRTPGADIRVGSAEEVPFADETFTAIWSLASMHHWPDRDAGLTAQVAKLAPGGRLLIVERLLTRPGHGITADQTAAVVAELTGLGLTEVHTEKRASGRKTLQAIHGRR